MTEDAQNTSDLSSSAELEQDQEPGTNEDAETSAARRELKQTTISDESTMPAATRSAKKLAAAASPPDATTIDAAAAKDDMGVTSEAGAAAGARTKTPDLKTTDLPPGESLQEQISSPKKKRAHDEVDEQRELASNSGATQEPAATADGRAPQSRSDRDEPEKKRPRDQKPADTAGASRDTETREPTSGAASPRPSQASEGDKKSDSTSSSAFAKSGFAKLATSSASPFGALGGSSKPNLFGGGGGSGAKPPASLSPFGALAAGGSKPTLGPSPTASQDSRSATASGSNSPFASLNGPTKGFGSGGFGSVTFGGGGGSAFGGGLGGPRLMTFGKPGEVLKSDKPAKPFGAPESDAEDDDAAEEAATGEEDEEGSESEERDREEKEKNKKEQQERERDADKEDVKSSSDDRKKPRLQRITVDDGETGEVTILQVRAKMFQLEDKETGWKERGSGMLKINVPESCVSFDELSGVPIAGSFDASGLEADSDEEDGGGARGGKIVRLIMRQDHTLRVILNTAIVGATNFQTREGLKATNIIFTAFEGDEGRPVQMKMNPANAQTFLNEVELIQRELQNA